MYIISNESGTEFVSSNDKEEILEFTKDVNKAFKFRSEKLAEIVSKHMKTKTEEKLIIQPNM